MWLAWYHTWTGVRGGLGLVHTQAGSPAWVFAWYLLLRSEVPGRSKLTRRLQREGVSKFGLLSKGQNMYLSEEPPLADFCMSVSFTADPHLQVTVQRLVGWLRLHGWPELGPGLWCIPHRLST